MNRQEFELAALSRKAPSIEQLLIMFHAAKDMTREKAIGTVGDLCLHCCRLQQEIASSEMMQNESKQRNCAKCGGSGMTQRWTGEHVECDACNAKGF